MQHTTHCKQCGCVVNVKIDDDCPITQHEIWLAMAVCNRCGDYKANTLRIEEACDRVAVGLIISRRQLPPGSPDLVKAESVASQVFTHCSKRYATIVCGFHRIANSWSDDIPELMLEKPWKTTAILRMMHTMAKQHAERRVGADALLI